MLGMDAPYVAGLGLAVADFPSNGRWKNNIAPEGKTKDEVPTDQLRRDCRAFAGALAEDPA